MNSANPIVDPGNPSVNPENPFVNPENPFVNPGSLRLDPDELIAVAALLESLAGRVATAGAAPDLTPAAAGRDEVSVAAATALREAAFGLRAGVESGAAELHRIAAALRHLAGMGAEADIAAATDLSRAEAAGTEGVTGATSQQYDV